MPLVRDAREYRSYDERAEPSPEPVFVRTDAMGVGHLAASLPLLIFAPALRCHKSTHAGSSPRAQGRLVRICGEGRQGRRTSVP
jgi:hypothetical protein